MVVTSKVQKWTELISQGQYRMSARDSMFLFEIYAYGDLLILVT